MTATRLALIVLVCAVATPAMAGLERVKDQLQ
jgi:hypothetical protein